MKMLVIGAAGPTGRAVVDAALDAGHDVTALAQAGAVTSAPHERLGVAVGDAADQRLMDEVVLGQDLVVLAVEATDRRPTTRFSDAAGTAVAALRKPGGPRRIAAVSSIWTDSAGLALGPRIYQDLIIHRRHHNPINDMMRMEDEVRRTDLDWTLVRPTVLTDGPATGRCRASADGPVPGGRRLSRRDLGQFVATRLEDPATYRRTLALAS